MWSNGSNCIWSGIFCLLTTARSLSVIKLHFILYGPDLAYLLSSSCKAKRCYLLTYRTHTKALSLLFSLKCKISDIICIWSLLLHFTWLLYWNTKSLVFLQGVKAVLAESYEKVHKSQLIGIGIAPLQFLPGENPSTLGLTGREQFSVLFPPELSPGMTLDVKVSLQYFV